jgi:aldose 1-epimerase
VSGDRAVDDARATQLIRRLKMMMDSDKSRRWQPFMPLLAPALMISACSDSDDSSSSPPVQRQVWGTTAVGSEEVELFTLENANGMKMTVAEYGCAIQTMMVPDRDGNLADVVLGYDNLAGYEGDVVMHGGYFGGIAGRYANRIGLGQFTLDGVDYQLAVNNGAHHLHGGANGFNKRVFDGEPFESSGARGVVLSYTSPDGEENYPGTVELTVTYTLTDDNSFVYEVSATTDEATPINVTQHSYYNLAGHDAGDVLDHVVMFNADEYTPLAAMGGLVTGDILPVAGTALDFRSPTSIDDGIGDGSDPQMSAGGNGYDHNFVMNGSGSRMVGRIVEPTSGRVMEITTEQPGLQFYTGNHLGGQADPGKGGTDYGGNTPGGPTRYPGFTVQTQHFPDSPNNPEFPNTILRPGEEYTTRTVYHFGTE